MNLTKLAGVLLAVFVVATGAAAALPGDAPTDSQAGQADDHAPEQAHNATEMNETADDERRGPPADMPDAAPDFVSQIHDLIQQKIDGTISNLGQQISELTPGGDAGQGHGQSSDAGSMAPAGTGPGR